MSGHPYISVGKFSIPEVLSQVGNQRATFGKYKVSMQAGRYWLYKNKGTNCFYCHLQGAYFSLERFSNVPESKVHFNLYALDGTMITRDHIIPVSRGGNSMMHNVQPLCTICNLKKSNTTDWE